MPVTAASTDTIDPDAASGRPDLDQRAGAGDLAHPTRSLLFVPGDSPRKLEKALGSGADILLLDLEDSVAPAAKQTARRTLAQFLDEARAAAVAMPLYVRVNPLDSSLIDADLDAVMAARPDGIVLPQCRSGKDVTHIDAKIAVREAVNGLTDGATRIVAIGSETPGALFGLGTYAGASQRLTGLAWGAEDLATSVGAAGATDAQGVLTDLFRVARALTLAGAVHAKVAPIDKVYVRLRDDAGLRTEAEAAAREGFVGKFAIHPAQIPIINAAFTPKGEDIAHARSVIAAFAEAGEAGAAVLDGAMLDAPHRLRAERVLARAAAAGIRF